MPHVAAVHEDTAFGRVVEPRNQAHERGLAGAGQADERHHFARCGGEVDVVQDLRAVRVLEAHILEADLAGDPGCVDRIRRVDGLRQRREHRPDALRAGEGPLQPAGRVSDLGQRAVHGAEIGDDHRQLAQAHAALQHVRAADHDDERRPQNRDHADDDREQRLLPGDGDACGHHLGAEPLCTDPLRIARARNS